MIYQKMVQKSFLKCCISNKLDGTEDDNAWQEDSNETENEDNDEAEVSENENQDKKKCGMTIMPNIHWKTGNISLGNLGTRVIVRMNLKYSETLFNL